jgi:hypothetical protein
MSEPVHNPVHRALAIRDAFTRIVALERKLREVEEKADNPRYIALLRDEDAELALARKVDDTAEEVENLRTAFANHHHATPAGGDTGLPHTGHDPEPNFQALADEAEADHALDTILYLYWQVQEAKGLLLRWKQPAHVRDQDTLLREMTTIFGKRPTTPAVTHYIAKHDARRSTGC